MRTKLLAAILIISSYLPTVADEQPDSVGKSFLLNDVSVSAVGPRRVIKADNTGAMTIDGAMLSEVPSLMSIPNPIALMSTLPAVATPNDLQAGISVRGGNPGDNYFIVDGARIVNPIHMLGFFSTFNPAIYKDYSFRADRIPAANPSFAGGLFEAHSAQQPDSTLHGSVTVGLIESNLGMNIPLKPSKISLAVGARKSYLNLLFPNILTLGTAHLDYGYTDLNLALNAVISNGHNLKISALATKDRLTNHINFNDQKDGNFGWDNLAAAASWSHKEMTAKLSYTLFKNHFFLTEGARVLDLPSDLKQTSAIWQWKPNKHWTVEADANIRYSSGQYNRNLGPAPDSISSTAIETNLAADYNLNLRCGLSLQAGIRLALYNCNRYTTAIPQPRVNLHYNLSDLFNPFIAYSRTAQFERLIQESSCGLPTDFRINADKKIPARVIDNFSIGFSGTITDLILRYNIEGYYRRSNHDAEFIGLLLDLTNPGYNPTADFADGKGYSAGLSAMIMRTFGRLRGRISYNLGVSRVKIHRLGPQYVPSVTDRLHDLNASITWEPLRGLTLTASFTHATGTPFTKAKYGYMLGENLICEYFPHNSSRLPAYNRLDIGAGYRFKKRGRLAHAVNLSVYNALASKNILFQYTSYSISSGIMLKESTMKSVIPSVAYTLTF